MNFDFRRSLLTGLSFALLGASQMATAEDASKVDVSTTLWTKFAYDMTKDSNHNLGFDLYRAFLRFGYKFDDTWSTALLIDGARSANTLGTGYAVNYVRNVYVQASNLWAQGGTMRFGFQPTFFISAVEGATHTRWLGASLAEEAGLEAVDTAGVAVWGGVNNMFKYGLMLHNGEENISSAGNTDNRFAADVMLAVNPFVNMDGAIQKLGIVLVETMSPQAKATKNGTPTTHGYWTTLGAVTFEHPFVDAAVEAAFSKQNSMSDKIFGYGLTANLKPLNKVSLYGRYFTGNQAFENYGLHGAGGKTTTVSINSTSGAISATVPVKGYKHVMSIGPTYSFLAGKVQTAVLYHNRWFKTGHNTEHSVSWNWAVNF